MKKITKRALAESLKKLLEKKRLDKITVTDVVNECGVNRQTFYYHFQDIYDLVEWIFLTEAAAAVGGNKTQDTWQKGFKQLFDFARENRSLVENTFYSLSREQLERYLYDVTGDLLLGVVEECASGMSVREEDKKFIADFYKYAFVGIVVEWIRRGMKDKPETIISGLDTLIRGDFTRALEKYRTDRPRPDGKA